MIPFCQGTVFVLCRGIGLRTRILRLTNVKLVRSGRKDWIDVGYTFLRRYTGSAFAAQISGWYFDSPLPQVGRRADTELHAGQLWAEQMAAVANEKLRLTTSVWLLVHQQVVARIDGGPPEVEVLIAPQAVFGDGLRHFVVEHELHDIMRRVAVGVSIEATVLQAFQLLGGDAFCDAVHRCQILCTSLGHTIVFEEWYIVRVPSAVTVRVRVQEDASKERMSSQAQAQIAEAQLVVNQLRQLCSRSSVLLGNL